MRSFKQVFCNTAFFLIASVGLCLSATAQDKPRIIVLTDIENEPDDAMSLVRFLTYSNQWDVEGLVATTSRHQRTATAAWRIREIVDAYAKVRDNLEKHEPGFPTADFLRSKIREGKPIYGMNAVGEGMDSPGSELIIETVDKEDDRPVWITVWGGPNCLAQALWKVKNTRSEAELADFVAKLRVYTISDQDDSGPWLRKTFPDLFFIASPGIHPLGAYHHSTWIGIGGDKFHGRFAGGHFEIVDNPWLDEHIRSKGPLGAEYPEVEFIMEGDSPSFMFLINNGLSQPDNPDWGSWGGRYEYYQPRTEKWFMEPETRPLWTNAQDEVMGMDGSWHTNNKATIWRWREHYQHDFSARMDWTIKPYAEANHPPVPQLAHEAYITAEVGDRIELSAAGSTDPDGDELTYHWFHYGELGSYTLSSGRTGAPLTIENADQQQAALVIPKSVRTGTLHIILAVTDKGTPTLTRYKRVIINVVPQKEKPRLIATTDGEVDDQCSLVRFLLYANEWDIEGIVTSSSQYHWQGHRWAGDDWVDPFLEAYEEVYPNLVQHDPDYPSPDYLRERTRLGNVKAEGEMEEVTEGSELIVNVLLDDTDDRPIWVHAWGGTNTIARALKTIEEQHPERMEEVAQKLRFFFIWEQDDTYQTYIQPHWGKYNIPTIICDQFWAIAYQWNKILPEDKRPFFQANWMKSNVLEEHGPLCALYPAHEPGSHGLSGDTDFDPGDFRSEGDSPAFLHNIPTGLRSMESPDFGGWGGRYQLVRENTWLDPVPFDGYEYPEGRWYTESAWGRKYMRSTYPDDQDKMDTYFKPLARWADVMQRDFAARADWCVRPFAEANHPPVVTLDHAADLQAAPGQTVTLSALGTFDPDRDALSYRWWQYEEADTYQGTIELQYPERQNTSFTVPADGTSGQTIHIICEVTDSGAPTLTRYQRVIVTITE